MNTTGARVLPSRLSKCAVVAQKFLNDPRFADAGSAVDNEVWHAVAGWVIDQVCRAFENPLGARILNPSLLPNPGDSLLLTQSCEDARRRLQVREL